MVIALCRGSLASLETSPAMSLLSVSPPMYRLVRLIMRPCCLSRSLELPAKPFWGRGEGVYEQKRWKVIISQRASVQMQIEKMISQVRNLFRAPVLFGERNECRLAGAGREQNSASAELSGTHTDKRREWHPQCQDMLCGRTAMLTLQKRPNEHEWLAGWL